MMSHHVVLLAAYSGACLLWLGLSRILPDWRNPARPTFAHPWRETGWVLLGAVGTILLGQLWFRGIRLEARSSWQPLAESVNQLLIFAPLLLVPLLRRQGPDTFWLPGRHIILRLTCGMALAATALGIYSLLEPGAPDWKSALHGVFASANIPHAVQVLLEDFAIALLFVRLADALGARIAVAAVSALFALGHVPALISSGASAAELLSLGGDFGIGLLVLATLWRSADILWFWPLHFALDMTQFLTLAPAAPN